MLTFHGSCRLTVVLKEAQFDQRLVVRTPVGTIVIPGTAGVSRVIDAHTWQLSLEHNYFGQGWRRNVRVVAGPVTERGGVRSQEVESKDVDWRGNDSARRNIVVRLESMTDEDVPSASARQPTAGRVPIPDAAPGRRTSSGSVSGLGLEATPGLATPRTGVQPSAPGRSTAQRGVSEGLDHGRY